MVPFLVSTVTCMSPTDIGYHLLVDTYKSCTYFFLISLLLLLQRLLQLKEVSTYAQQATGNTMRKWVQYVRTYVCMYVCL